MTKVTFTTEFLEYYEALAMASHSALVAGIKAVIPGAAPTAAELYGPNFNPTTAAPEARAQAFRGNATNNPWNDGRKGILCLAQQFNTLGALFNLGGHAAVPKPNVPVGSVCASLGGFCGPDPQLRPVDLGRRADARPGQTRARASPIRSASDRSPRRHLADRQHTVDVNDPAANQGVWTITRGGRRAVLKVVPGLMLDDDKIESGAQVAAVLSVVAQRGVGRRGRPAGVVAGGAGAVAAARRGRQRRSGRMTTHVAGWPCCGSCVVLGGAVTHAQLRKQVRDGAPIQALTAAERAALGDPFFTLVLQTSPAETTLDGDRTAADGHRPARGGCSSCTRKGWTRRPADLSVPC